MGHFKKITSIFAVLLSCVLLFSACKSTEKIKETQNTLDTDIQGEPQQGGSLTLGITQEPDSFDPYLAAAAGTKEIIYNFFDGLVKLLPNGTFEPALAEKYDVSDDAKIFTFQIRQGVKFHNDKDLTVGDVVYSLENASGLGEDKTLKISQLSIIDKIEADADNNQVIVTLKDSDADFISYMTLAIVPEDYTEQATKPIGTGPFVFTEYQPQKYVKMTKNENYWRDRKAYLDDVTFLIMPSADAAIVDLQAGNIDIFPYLTADKKDLLEDKYNFITTDSNMVQIWGLNNKQAPFDDPIVRKAMNMAIDKQMLIDTVTFGEGKVLESGMAPAMGQYFNGDLDSEYNPEAAKELLEENGYQDLKITITVPGNYVIHVQSAEVVAAQLEQIGVEAEIKSVDWGTWLSNVYQGREYQSTIIALTFDYVAPATVLKHYYSSSDADFINYENSEFDTLYEKAQSITDVDERIALYHQMQKLLQDDSASVFLQNPGVQTAVSKKLAGYTTYPQYVQDMYEVYYIAD